MTGSPKVIGAPEHIWLVYGDLDEDLKHDDCKSEVSWCSERIGDGDVRYVRDDLAKRITTPPKQDAMAAEVEQPCKTPVQDLLRAIPADHRITFETDDNGFKVWHSCPIGTIAHEADDLIDRQQAEIERLTAQLPRWISVSESLPAYDLPVLVMSKPWPGQMFAAMRVDGGDGWLWAVSSSYHDCLNSADSYAVDDDYEFSHWQPLPSAPTENEHEA